MSHLGTQGNGSINARKRKRDDTHVTIHATHAESEESDEEFDFENVDLNGIGSELSQKPKDDAAHQSAGIQVKLEEAPSGNTKYATAVIARRIRFEIHKLHVLCLLSHAALRNQWSTEDKVAQALSRIAGQISGNVHAKKTSAPIQRTRILLESLEKISDLWSKSFRISRNGLSKAKWFTEATMVESSSEEISQESSIGKDEFLQAARNLQGDRDIGSQLFVALLRSLKFEVRLVCSLQPLGLSASKLNLATSNRDDVANQIVDIDKSEEQRLSELPRAVQRKRFSRPKLGQSAPTTTVARPKPQPSLTTPSVQSRYPVYWAEVFDAAAQKWYSVDPLVTGGVNRPKLFEPPQSDIDNTMSYVVAFESDNSAKDVTLRYTTQFNAKIRRTRVEGASNIGAAWWTKVMRFYGRRQLSDRHAIENAELAQRSLSEGIPANVADLKNHPLFVIERHLRKHEIIDPLRECGSIRIGKGQPIVVEKVYPRKYVKSLHSAQSWYMQGREIRQGELPLKSISGKSVESEDFSGASSRSVELFAEEQTTLYTPAPIESGIVIKNQFGNIDLFTPSMLPQGALHCPGRDAEAAAQLLAIDYAAAVTGFDHSSRQSVPIKRGVVVACEYGPAMQAVETAIFHERSLEIERKTSLAALTRWVQFLRSLRIRQHVEARYGGAGRDYDTELKDEESILANKDSSDTGGGFM